jgi:flagellar protein FlbD
VARFTDEETTVIWVTRLNGTEMALNSDLVEAIESTPDTVLTLVDGKRYVIQESVAEVIDRIRRFRASILGLLDTPAASAPPAPPAPTQAANLYVVPSES